MQSVDDSGAVPAARQHTVVVTVSALLALGLGLAGSAGSVPAPGKRDREKPSIPTNIRVTSATPTTASVAWDPSTDNVRVAGYYVYLNYDHDNARRVRVSSTEFTAANLDCGESATVWIAAYDSAMNRSDVATAMVATAACIDTQAPTPPEGFRQTATTEEAVVLEWNASLDNVGVVEYGVYRNQLFLESTSDPSVGLGGLSCGSTYEFHVDAVDAAGNRSQRRSAWTRTAACPDKEPPSAPTDLAVAGKTETTLTIAWSPSTDNVAVAGYRVTLGGVTVATVTQPGATLSNITCNTTYGIAVEAFDAAGNHSSPASITASTAACSQPSTSGDTSVPSAPTGLTVQGATGTSVSLRWSASTDNVGVQGYGVYVNGTRVQQPTQTAATVSGLSCGIAYTFGVDAYDAAANRSTRTEMTATTSACADTQSPSAPANVGASSRTATSIALTWSASSDNVGVTGYGLYRGGTPAGTGAGTTGIFSNLTCNTNYTLGVDAFDGAGNRSAKTTVMVATTACADTIAPSAPTGLAVSNPSQTGLTLNWNASSDNVGVAGYDTYLNGSKVGSPSSASYTFGSLTCATSYTLGVVAYDAAGNRSSPASASGSTTACSQPPPSPPSEWKFCANEGQQCTFVGMKEARYGANGTFTSPRTFTDGVACNNQVFGDPLVGVQKLCELRDATSSTQPPPSPSASGFPASFTAGPLGGNNILPPKNPGVLMATWPQGASPGSSRYGDYANRESQLGRKLDIYATHYGSPGGGCDYGSGSSAFTSGEEQWARDTGHFILINWVPGFSMAQVNAGAADSCFAAFGQRAGAFGQAVLLRIYWEFDGTWMPWRACGQEFINGWRRTVTKIREGGGTNVGFVWSPDGYDRNCANASYPGDDWVDWVGDSMYNRDDSNTWYTPFHAGWADFGEILSFPSANPPSIYDTYSARKPFMTAETGAEEDPDQAGRKGQWFAEAKDDIKANYPALRAFVYFDVDVRPSEPFNWRLTTSQSSLDGFKALATDPHFNTR